MTSSKASNVFSSKILQTTSIVMKTYILYGEFRFKDKK